MTEKIEALTMPKWGIEMEEGKIKIWRDYFDMGTYTKPFYKDEN